MGFLTTGIGTNFGSGATHPVYEGYSFDNGGAQVITMESFDDNLAVFEALSELDIHVVRNESDTAVIEGAVTNVIERVKTAFKKLWGKMKAFFDTIVRYFDALTKSAADFAKKYEKQLTAKSLSGFKYKMFKYSIPEAPEKNETSAEKVLDPIANVIADLSAGATSDGAKERLQKAKEGYEDLQDEIRGELLNKSKLDAEDFRKELFAFFRSGAEGADDKEETTVEIHKVIADVKASPKLKRAVEAAKKHTDSTFAKYLKDLSAAQKKVEMKDGEGNDDHTGLSVLAGAVGFFQKSVTFQKTTILQFYSAWIDAIKERDRTYKSVMQAAFRHKED